MMDTSIPDDLLEIKARFDAWRKNRKHLREPVPDDLRQAVVEMSRRYPSSLVRRVLKLDPSRFKKSVTNPAVRTRSRQKPQPPFFELLADATSPDPASAPRSVS